MHLDTLTPDERRAVWTAYLDGELSDAEARVVAAWLAVHPEARAEVDALRRVWDLLGAYGDEPVPEGFTRRVLSATAGEGLAPLRVVKPDAAGAPRWARLPVARPLAAAAALLLALGAGAYLLSRLLPGGLAPNGLSSDGQEPRESALAIESVPGDLLEHADVLLSLSEEELDAVLEVDPDDLADPVSGNTAAGG
jgi:anti-sigma factor RsiW